MKTDIFKHKGSPGYGGGHPYVSPYLLEVLSTRSGAPAFSVAQGTLTANAPGLQAATCTRAASAYCLGNDNLLHLLGPNTVRVEPLGLLVEGAATNLLGRSNTFSNATWVKDGTTGMTQDVTGPDGVASSGWTWLASAGGGVNGHRFYQTISGAAATTAGTGSIYLKRGNVDFCGFSVFDGQHEYLIANLALGTIVATAGSRLASSSITALANGWYRVTVSISGAAGTAAFMLIYPADTQAHAVPDTNWTAAGTETCLAWQADYCEKRFASSPIVTAAASVTRDADVVYFTNPLAALGTGAPGTWSIGAVATPIAPWAQVAFAVPGFMGLGGNGDPNTFRCYTIGNDCNFQVFDAASNRATNPGSVFSGSAATTLAFSDTLGVITSTPSGSASGAGNGVISTQPARANPGSLNGGNSSFCHITNFYVTGALTAPGAPTIGTATGGDTNATLTWTAPAATGGAAIASYLVTSNPSTTQQTLASGGTFTGLTNGVAYTFTVQAINSVGTSVASSASNSVTPSSFTPPADSTYLSNTIGGAGADNRTNLANWLNPGAHKTSQALNATNYLGAANSSNTLTSDTSNGLHDSASGLISASGWTKFGGAFKTGAGNAKFVCLYNSTSNANYTVFDLTNGTISSNNGSATGTINAIGNGFYWCQVTLTAAGANVIADFAYADTAAHATPTGAFTGTTGDQLICGPFACSV